MDGTEDEAFFLNELVATLLIIDVSCNDRDNSVWLDNFLAGSLLRKHNDVQTELCEARELTDADLLTSNFLLKHIICLLLLLLEPVDMNWLVE